MPAILIIIGGILIYFSLKSIKKENYNNFEKILKNKEENIEIRDVEIAKLKVQFSETILELQKEIYSIKENLEEKKYINSELEENIFDNIKEDVDNEELNEETINKEISKSEQVRRLEEAGFTDDEICSQLNLGKGEVLLIKGLYKGLRV